MIIKLTPKQCDALKCDTCHASLCEQVGDGFEIKGHYNMGDAVRCVICYGKNQLLEPCPAGEL